MIGIRGQLLREQAMLLRRETLNRFQDGLIRGSGFHNDLLSRVTACPSMFLPFISYYSSVLLVHRPGPI